jgi:hypothetical protein
MFLREQEIERMQRKKKMKGTLEKELTGRI